MLSRSLTHFIPTWFQEMGLTISHLLTEEESEAQALSQGHTQPI
jgi:hypothetical protein